MATDFALLEAQLGAATTAAFFNAAVVLPGGATLQGVLSQPYAGGVGNLAMPGRDVVLIVRTASLTVPVTKGTAINTVQTAGTIAWLVVRRHDMLETGDTELQLERP